MNKAYLIGNLASDPELRTLSSGTTKCEFRLAVSRRFANQQGVRETDFFTIVAWRQLADLCARYLSKGRKCAVVGSIQNRSYDAQDGSKRYVTEIIAEEVEFLGSSQDRAQSAPAEQGMPEPPARSAAPAPARKESGFTEIEDDELPF